MTEKEFAPIRTLITQALNDQGVLEAMRRGDFRAAGAGAKVDLNRKQIEYLERVQASFGQNFNLATFLEDLTGRLGKPLVAALMAMIPVWAPVRRPKPRDYAKPTSRVATRRK